LVFDFASLAAELVDTFNVKFARPAPVRSVSEVPTEVQSANVEMIALSVASLFVNEVVVADWVAGAIVDE
jgi:hypothetical protein